VAVVLLFCFTVPRSWLEVIFSPRSPRAVGKTADRPVLVLLPVPEIEVVLEPSPAADEKEEHPPPPGLPALWWQAAWQTHLEGLAGHELLPVRGDSLAAEVVQLFDSVMASVRRAEPVCSRARKLAVLRLRELADITDLKPLLQGLARSRRYAEILNTKAMLFGDFLAEEIPVPDAGKEVGR